jgi:hypothetical protein
MSTPVGPGELFARSQGAVCEGKERCHWCLAPCSRAWPHDDAPPAAYVRSLEGAKNPTGPYACEGCRLHRRRSCTVWWLSGGLSDRQSLRKTSWWATPEGARAIRKQDHEKLWELLLAPPPTFCLSLLESGRVDNMLHRCVVNDHKIVTAETELHFTVDNVKHSYSVYELKEACKHGAEGKSPGVLAVVRVLGEHPLPDEKHVEHRRGRPPKHEDDDIRRVISKR